MTMRCVLLSIMFLGLAVPVQANGVLYDCTITQKRKGLGWISDKMAIVLTEDGKAVVSDGIILHYLNKPLQARIERNTNRKLAVRWRLKNIVNSDNQQTPAFDYSATITKSSNKIAVYASPEGYPNRFTGKGTCILKNAK